jgi:hypothetical protein
MRDRLCQFVVGCIEEKKRLLLHEGTKLFVDMARVAYACVRPHHVITGAGVLICAATQEIEPVPPPNIAPLEERADNLLLGLMRNEGWGLTETVLILEAALSTIAANAARWHQQERQETTN